MRPLKLIMQAFGPYAKEQVLDFSVLEERSLFLIHGPTGAGKTSILDAICFALYGETSGGERQAKHMRSDHANPNLLTEVTFDFILGAETYRVFRRPEQERPKRRGGGTTKEPAKATLWKRTNVKGDEDEGIVIADRWSRVNEEMERILGFRSDQFRQVVVLPQGQFRRFLSAASQERQKILQVLFQTEFYHQIEESLKHAANEAKNRLVKLHEKRKEILKRFGVDNVEALHKKLSDVEKERGVIEERIKTLREEEILVFKKLEEAKEIIKKFGEYEEAKKEFNVIEAKKEEFKEKQKRLDMAKRALSLRDVENEVSNREEELIEVEKKLKLADGDLKSAQKKKEKADKDVEIEDLREEERDRVRREVDRLESLRLDVEEFSKHRKRLIELKEKVKNLSILCEEKKNHIEECTKALKEAQEEREALLSLAAQVGFREVEYHNLQRINEKRKQLDKLYKEYKKAEVAFSELQSRLNRAKEDSSSISKELERLDERWWKSQAALLAQQLKANTPCPVCGSREHPNPARYEGEMLRESDFKRAKKKLKEKLKDVDKLIKELEEKSSLSRDRVVELKTQIQNLEEELKDKDISTIEQRIKEAESLLNEAKKAEKRIAELELWIKELKEAKGKNEKELKEAEDELQASKTDLAVTNSQLEQLESKIPEELRTKDELEEAIKRSKDKYKKLEKALKRAKERQRKAMVELAEAEATFRNVREAESRARNLADRARKTFMERLKSAGFMSIEDYEAYRMDEHAIEALEAEIQEFNRRLLEAEERMHRAKKEVRGLEKPELKPIEERCKEIKNMLEEVLRRSGEVNNTIEQLSSAVGDVDKVDKEIGEKEVYYGIIGHLEEVASGRNLYNITFERFVLATLLDDVLVAASTRLRMMSNGRFDLQRLDRVGDRRKAGGLELIVYDAYTGTTRPVNTLSGGEGFLASLSLALGLADAVQSYAGGIKLDTIFIDEGFGSLDPESLDLALRALVDLQEEGRLVGIISHVPELKERVDVRLEVVPSKSGSEAKFIV